MARISDLFVFKRTNESDALNSHEE